MDKIRVIESPSGRFVYVGKVPTAMAFVQKDGSPATAKQIDGAKHAGPGFVGIRERSFATVAEAVQFAADNGHEAA